MKKKVSFVTVGHSPREDIMDELQSHLSEEIEVRQLGALDSLSIREVKDHYDIKTVKWRDDGLFERESHAAASSGNPQRGRGRRGNDCNIVYQRI